VPRCSGVITSSRDDVEARRVEHPFQLRRRQQSNSLEVFLPAHAYGLLDVLPVGAYRSKLLHCGAGYNPFVAGNQVHAHFIRIQKVEHERAASPGGFADAGENLSVLAIVIEITEAREQVDGEIERLGRERQVAHVRSHVGRIGRFPARYLQQR